MKTCPKCKMSGIPDDARFCPRCGQNLLVSKEKVLQRISNSTLNNSSKSHGEKSKVLWIILVILVIVIGVIGAILEKYLYDKNSYISTNPTCVDCNYKGGGITIDVNTNRDWKISTYTGNWCHLTKNSQSVQLQITENYSSEPRQDYFILEANGRSCRVNIRQKGKPYLRVSSTQLSMSGTGGNSYITINSSEPWRISNQPESWVSISTTTNGISVCVSENLYTSSRSTSFIVQTDTNRETITISQSATAYYLRISDQYPEFEKEGGHQTITIDSYSDWYISSYPNRNWIGVQKNGRNLIISCSANTGEHKREAWITIKAHNIEKTIYVKQWGTDEWEKLYI